jgi:hypothetical protein
MLTTAVATTALSPGTPSLAFALAAASTTSATPLARGVLALPEVINRERPHNVGQVPYCILGDFSKTSVGFLLPYNNL